VLNVLSQYGHKSCKETVSSQKETACIIAKNTQQKQVKQIELANQYFVSIIDAASD